MNGSIPFGVWVKQHRKALDLTQEELAERAGCAAVTVRKIEAGEYRPSKQIAQKLAECLGITPGQHDEFVRYARGGHASAAHLLVAPQPMPPGAQQRSDEPLSSSPNNLPTISTPLIGRRHTVTAVANLLLRPSVRLLTLTGAPGIGKTRLGLQVATQLIYEFQHGVFMVPLSSTMEADLVAATIAHAITVKESAGRSITESMLDYLKDKQMLLLLDNFEHVLPAAPLLAQLISACPGLKLLVTSRAALHLHGEQQFQVPTLGLPELTYLPDLEALLSYPAVQLFVARAQAVNPDFVLNKGNAGTVAQICSRLEGLPLALELAATRINVLPPHEMLGRLTLTGHPRLRLLTGGARDLPTRQRTLRDAIDWSYSLLDKAEQSIFRQLAVFVGGCTLDAAEAVCQIPDSVSTDVLDAVGSLMDKSLLRAAEISSQKPGPTGSRFIMLETIREFAFERLVESGESEAAQRRHVEYYLELAERAAPELKGPQQSLWLNRLEQEHDNYRAALAWKLERGEVGVALRLITALWSFWYVHNHLTEGRRWLDHVLAQSSILPVYLQAKAQDGAGTLAWAQGDYVAAKKFHQASLELRRDLGDRSGIATSLAMLGMVATGEGNLKASEALFEESLALRRELGDKWGTIISLLNLGTVVLNQGDPAKATSLFEECLALYDELGDRWGMAVVLNNLGQAAHNQEDFERAMNLQRQSVALFREAKDEWGVAAALINLGYALLMHGDHRQAQQVYAQSLTLSHDLGDKARAAACLEGLATVAGAQGKAQGMVRLVGAAETLKEAIGVPVLPSVEPQIRGYLADARVRLGEVAFGEFLTEGQAMSLEQAVEYALGELR